MVNQSYSPSLLKAYQQQQGCAAAPRPPWKSCIPLNEEEWLHKPTTNSKASVCRPKVPVLYAENWCRNKTWQSPQARIRYMVKCLPVPLQARASSITPVNGTCCPLTRRLRVWIPISLYFFFFFFSQLHFLFQAPAQHLKVSLYNTPHFRNGCLSNKREMQQNSFPLWIYHDHKAPHLKWINHSVKSDDKNGPYN